SSGKPNPQQTSIGDVDHAIYSFKYSGPSEAGMVVYYVDGNGNGTCDEPGAGDARGVQTFTAADQRISVEFNSSDAVPEWVCERFAGALTEGSFVATPTPTPLQATATPTVTDTPPTATPVPSYSELYREEALAAVQRFYDAQNAHDQRAIERSVTKRSQLFVARWVEQLIDLREQINSEEDYEQVEITELSEIECEEELCKLWLVLHYTYPSGASFDLPTIIHAVRLEDGEWKMALGHDEADP
ncbi:MAG: hypothetical protein QGG56_09670, partial [Dehalococcoidia bacterium]|nr:hypothetical protein [Dehalococcoidia bacterium]